MYADKLLHGKVGCWAALASNSHKRGTRFSRYKLDALLLPKPLLRCQYWLLNVLNMVNKF